MHNTGFFQDCYLLSVTDGSIWIPHLARYSEIFGDIQGIQFSGSKMEVHVHLKNAFTGGIGNPRVTFGYNLWFASHHSEGSKYICMYNGSIYIHITIYIYLYIYT